MACCACFIVTSLLLPTSNATAVKAGTQQNSVPVSEGSLDDKTAQKAREAQRDRQSYSQLDAYTAAQTERCMDRQAKTCMQHLSRG